MRRGYKAFLMGTATDLPTRPTRLVSRKSGDELLASLRKWNKVISSTEQ